MSKALRSSNPVEAAAQQFVETFSSEADKAQDGDIREYLDDATLQRLSALVLQIYAQKARREDKGNVPPVDPTDVSATDAVIFIDQLLRAVNLELFEVQMWRSLGRQ